MKPILFYDSETTGLPLWDKPSEDPTQPRITQICAELVDDDTREVYAALNTLIRPAGWVIPHELEVLTGITTEKCMSVGMPIKTALHAFMAMWRLSALRVGHNESFDMRMMRIEIKRTGFDDKLGPGDFADEWKAGLAYCTQAKSTPIVKLPPTPKMIAAGRRHFKSANLGEAYQFFTGMKLEGAHNSAVDVMACKAVYFSIREMDMPGTPAARATPARVAKAVADPFAQGLP